MSAALDNTIDFDRWAVVYDEHPNAFLRLEERTLRPLLPSLSHLDVLDVGCGTGRWLQWIEQQQPSSLTGIDPSAQMLHRARARITPAVVLHQASSTSIPAHSSSIDVLLASFVAGHIEDLEQFASECARIVRPQGTVILADIHSTTARARNWRRTFHSQGKTIELNAHNRPLSHISHIFRSAGFALTGVHEPCFGPEEASIFASADMLHKLDELAGLPAIYILELKRLLQSRPEHNESTQTGALRIDGALCALSSSSSVACSITMQRGCFTSFGPDDGVAETALDLTGYLVLPGLINAHDHLEFALFPKLGRSPAAEPYTNAAQWAAEIHQVHAATIEIHLSVPRETRLWWGGIRNLLDGVTTVCHHNPREPLFSHPGFPVRVLSKYGWSHSLSPDPHIEESFRTTPLDQPFFVHAAEGTDEQSADEIFELQRRNLLDSRTVLVHGLGLGAAGVDLLNRSQAALVCCPTSNEFLFHRLPNRDVLLSLQHLALGSDSPLTASGGLLDEVQCAVSALHLPHRMIYSMVTTSATSVLRLHHGEGCLRLGGVADMVAVRRQPESEDSPAATLVQLDWRQVEIVFIRGHVQLASQAIYSQLPAELRNGLHPLLIDGQLRWLRAPVRELLASAESILGSGNVRLGGRSVHNAG